VSPAKMAEPIEMSLGEGKRRGQTDTGPRNYGPLSSGRQHLSYDVCLEVRGEIIRTVVFCIVF